MWHKQARSIWLLSLLKYISGYELYEACKPEIKECLVKSLKILPPKAAKHVAKLLVQIADKNDDRVRKSIFTPEFITELSEYVDAHGRDEESAIVDIGSFAHIIIMTDKLDGKLLRDYAYPFAQKLCTVANEAVSNNAKYNYVPRITEMIEAAMLELPCSNPQCSITGRNFKACGKCRNAKYCSPECQKENWKTHKQVCFQLKADPEQKRKPDLAATKKYIKEHRDDITSKFKVDIHEMVVIVNFTKSSPEMVAYSVDEFFSSIIASPPFNSHTTEIEKAHQTFLTVDQVFIAICIQSDRVHTTIFNLSEFWYTMAIPLDDTMPQWYRKMMNDAKGSAITGGTTENGVVIVGHRKLTKSQHQIQR